MASPLGLPLTTQTRPPAPVIDYHQHLFSSAIANAGAARPIVPAKELVTMPMPPTPQGPGAVAGLPVRLSLPACRLQPVSEGQGPERLDQEQVAQYPERLVGFCSINPLRDYALDEIARCGKDERLHRGLKLHFGNSDVDFSNRAHVTRLKAVFGLANRQRMAIVVHMRASVTMSGKTARAGRGRFSMMSCRRAGVPRTSRIWPAPRL